MMNVCIADNIDADLHCHTTASDGKRTPEELVELAVHKGLAAIAVTDHDTLGGIAAAAEREKSHHGRLKVIPGIELNTEWRGTEVHILGYEIDPASELLRERLQTLRDYRKKRAAAIIAKLNQLGVPLSLEQVWANVRGDSLGRPHIAQTLVQCGYASDPSEAFRRYLGKDAPAYIPSSKVSPEEGIQLIRAAGGVPVLAHPGKNPFAEALPHWIGAGLQGIEVFHTDHDKSDEKRWRRLSGQYRLLGTGGSDYHGLETKHGGDLGGKGVRYAVVLEIQRQARQNKKLLGKDKDQDKYD
ncbi:MAG: PHP domain-containing protein [Peptococcaceae bacterium]|jgi:predicted metal-dependent phosphoesterase TrpH|nr:PHP domain-containing protein [Peptococcaceae bacterium]